MSPRGRDFGAIARRGGYPQKPVVGSELQVQTRALRFKITPAPNFLSGREHSAVPIPAVSFARIDEARLWEIAENLHRADLTTLERSEHIAEWVRLTDKIGQVAQFSKVGAGRGNEGGISAAAREIGVERTEVRRAEKVASISDDAKEAAREAGLDDNQSVLLKVARV